MDPQEANEKPPIDYPPAITQTGVETGITSSRQTVHLGRISVCGAVLSFGAWICVLPVLFLMSLAKASTNASDIAFHCCYFLGLVLACASIAYGVKSRFVWVGKLGLFIGAITLMGMIGFTVWVHGSTGSGQWLWKPGVVVPAGCGGFQDYSNDNGTGGGKEGDD